MKWIISTKIHSSLTRPRHLVGAVWHEQTYAHERMHICKHAHWASVLQPAVWFVSACSLLFFRYHHPFTNNDNLIPFQIYINCILRSAVIENDVDLTVDTGISSVFHNSFQFSFLRVSAPLKHPLRINKNVLLTVLDEAQWRRI